MKPKETHAAGQLRKQRRRTKAARKFMLNTCPASRHLHLMAESLARGDRYHMLEEEPEHCALTMLSVLESLWTLRTETGWPSDKLKNKMTKALTKAFNANP